MILGFGEFTQMLTVSLEHWTWIHRPSSNMTINEISSERSYFMFGLTLNMCSVFGFDAFNTNSKCDRSRFAIVLHHLFFKGQ